MKKTLAAVLAAAMALSTATVVFAKDTGMEPDIEVGSVTDSTTHEAKMGGDTKYRITRVDLDDGNSVTGSQLSRALDEGQITAKVVITNGLDKLAGLPTLTPGKYTGLTSGVKQKPQYRWDAGQAGLQAEWNTISGLKKKIPSTAEDEEITVIAVDANDLITNDADLVKNVYYKGDPKFITILEDHFNNHPGIVKKVIENTTVEEEFDAIQLKFKINHTYGTDAVKVAMKFRFTVKKGDKGSDGKYGSELTLGSKTYKKGDTLTSEEVKFEAKYNELSNYYEDMQLTKEELDANNVILDGRNLYDAIGDKRFTIYFGDDVAAFESKASASQKKVNLYYNLDDNTDLTSAYPGVDFEFITFLGNSNVRFVNSGKLTFNAIGGKESAVYRVVSTDDGVELEDLNGEYNSTYNTITTTTPIKDLKGTFVVAEKAIDVPDDEDNEPVDSAPIVEEPSSSEAPSNSGEKNPSTGAC